MRELLRRLHYLLFRHRFDRELQNDLEFHREMAALYGRQPFASTLRVREEAREVWGWTWLERTAQDIRYAARLLRRSPGFTVTAVLILALGTGISIAAFGFFDIVVLKPLPIRDPHTLRRFERSAPGHFSDTHPYPALAFYREHATTLSDVLGLHVRTLALDEAERLLRAHFVTANTFNDLGARPRLGRLLDPVADEAADAAPSVVLDQRFWERHFDADPAIIGRSIRLAGKPATIVGVASSAFTGLSLDRPDIWLPLVQHPYYVPGSTLLTDVSERGVFVAMWGRLRAGATSAMAEEELRSLAAVFRQRHPDGMWENERLPGAPAGALKGLLGGRPPLTVAFALMAAFCLLILIVSCGNLGSLLVARGVARGHEMAIRASVGAGRARLVRQLFTESLVLAMLGAAAGLGVGALLLSVLMRWSEVPSWVDATPDWRVIVFAIGLGVLTALFFGLVPSWQIAQGRHRARRTRQILIAAQVAASCVLLVLAGLFARALHRATSAHPGFDYARVIAIDAGLQDYTPAAARAYLDTLDARLRVLPGVEAFSFTTNPPLGNRWSVARADIDGRATDIHINTVDPRFFETMGIPIVRGRTFVRGDADAIVVSESLAARQWPGQEAVGRRLVLNTGSPGAARGLTVVGVAGNARMLSPEDGDAVELYRLANDGSLPHVVALVRTSGVPEAILRPAATIAKALDPTRLPEVRPLTQSFAQKLRASRYAAAAISALGFGALALACVGIVGLVAFTVAQRTQEIGLRIALGAPPARIVMLVLRQFARPVALGLIAGIGLAAALSQVLRRVLYGVSHLDPLAYGAAIVLFLGAVMLAAMVPAKHAARLDPWRALRHE